MKWMQFFTPVSTITWEEAQQLIDLKADQNAVLLDVREPKEYAEGHQPGAKLIPLGELESRLGELDKDQPIIIY